MDAAQCVKSVTVTLAGCWHAMGPAKLQKEPQHHLRSKRDTFCCQPLQQLVWAAIHSVQWTCSPVDVSTVAQVWVVSLLGGIGQHKLDHLLGTLCGFLQEQLHSGSHQLQLDLQASNRGGCHDTQSAGPGLLDKNHILQSWQRSWAYSQGAKQLSRELRPFIQSHACPERRAQGFTCINAPGSSPHLSRSHFSIM